MGKDVTRESLEDLPNMLNPKVSIVTSKDDLRDTIEDPEVPNDWAKEVPDKLDKAKSDDEKDIKNCYELENFGILDCVEISEDSPEKISGGERNIGYDALCDPELDVAKVPPLHCGITKRRRRSANDDKRLVIYENSNCKHFSNTSPVMEADSTEQLSWTQEDKDLATLLLMGKGEDQKDDSMDSVYNREEKQPKSATARVSEDQSVVKTDQQTSQEADLYPFAMGECFTEYFSIKETGQNQMICSGMTQKQDEDSILPVPVTEPSPVLVCDTSDYYLTVCDRKSEPVLDIDPRSCQRKWSTKTKTEYHSDVTKKRRVIPREDSENWFHVSEICYNNFDNFCLIHFYFDNLLKISRSISRDVPEVLGMVEDD